LIQSILPNFLVRGHLSVLYSQTLIRKILKETTMLRIRVCTILGLLLAPLWALAQQSDWQPVTGADALRNFVSDRNFAWTDGKGDQSGEYRADGTGTVHGARLGRRIRSDLGDKG
jgi:hypothetical protein